MKVNRESVLAYLRELEERNGGYYGTDLMNFAEKLGVTWRGLKKRLAKWLIEDVAFIGLHYLGRHKPSITLNEFIDIESRIVSNPLEVRDHIYSDINKERETSGNESITKTTFYRAVKQTLLTQFHDNVQYPWFACKYIKMPSAYSVAGARDSLSTIFIYSDLRTYGGADIQAIL